MTRTRSLLLALGLVLGSLSAVAGAPSAAADARATHTGLTYGMAHIAATHPSTAALGGLRALAHGTHPTRSFDAAPPLIPGPCLNGDCYGVGGPLAYNGGPLLSHPTIYLVNFSDSLNVLSPASGFVDSAFAPNAPNALGAAQAATSGGYASWWQQEYSVPGYNLQPGTVAGVVTLYQPALADGLAVSDSAIGAALSAARQDGTLPAGPGALYVTLFRAGQVVWLGSPTANSNTTFCGYHSSTTDFAGVTFPYIVLPNEAGNGGCAAGTSAQGTAGSSFDALTTVLSHELVEAVTDPYGTGWNVTASVAQQGDEVADICANGVGSSTVVPAAGATYLLQYDYSNSARGCLAASLASALSLSRDASGVTVRLYTANGAVPGEPVTVSGSGGTHTLTTDGYGLAHVSGLDGTVTASFAGTGGLSASSATLGSTGTTPVSLSANVTADPTVTTGDPYTLHVGLSGASGPVTGPVQVFDEYGRLLRTLDVTDGVGAAIVPAMTGDRLDVVFAGDATAAGASAYATVPALGTITVSGPLTGTSNMPTQLSVQVSPVVADANVVLEGAGGVMDATTDAHGRARLDFQPAVAGPVPMAIYVVTPYSLLSTSVTMDFTTTVLAQLSISGGVFSASLTLNNTLNLATMSPMAYASAPVTLSVGPRRLALTTDANGQVTYPLSGVGPGAVVTLAWPASPYASAGQATIIDRGRGTSNVPLARALAGAPIVDATGRLSVILRGGVPYVLYDSPRPRPLASISTMRSIRFSATELTVVDRAGRPHHVPYDAARVTLSYVDNHGLVVREGTRVLDTL